MFEFIQQGSKPELDISHLGGPQRPESPLVKWRNYRGFISAPFVVEGWEKNLKERDARLGEQHKNSAGTGLPSSRDEAISPSGTNDKAPSLHSHTPSPAWPCLPPKRGGRPQSRLSQTLCFSETSQMPGPRPGQVCKLAVLPTHHATAGKSLGPPELREGRNLTIGPGGTTCQTPLPKSLCGKALCN